MSSLTDEWHLKRENRIKYWIDVHGFNRKMDWRSGREIYSRQFKISESVFRIKIYPNGNNSEDKGNVSVFLYNNSSWRVKLAGVTFKVRHHENTIAPNYYQPGDGWGLSLFVAHDQIVEDDLLDGNRFTLEVDVELLEEEVPTSRPLDNEGDSLLSLKNEVSTIKTEMKDMREEFSRQLNEIKNNIGGGSALRRCQRVECPVCLEEVKPPMRLRQCGLGHIICDSCFHQNQGDRSLCFICKGSITGRPTELESLLGLTQGGAS